MPSRLRKDGARPFAMRSAFRSDTGTVTWAPSRSTLSSRTAGRSGRKKQRLRCSPSRSRESSVQPAHTRAEPDSAGSGSRPIDVSIVESSCDAVVSRRWARTASFRRPARAAASCRRSRRVPKTRASGPRFRGSSRTTQRTSSRPPTTAAAVKAAPMIADPMPSPCRLERYPTPVHPCGRVSWGSSSTSRESACSARRVKEMGGAVCSVLRYGGPTGCASARSVRSLPSA
jgi:hypothetical protein